MKDLLIVSSHGLGESTMAANRLRRLVQYLLLKGWEIYILCPRLGREALPVGPKLHLHSFSFITNGQTFLSKFGRKVIYPILGTVAGLIILLQNRQLHVVSTIPEIEVLLIGSTLKALFPSRVQLTLEVRDPFSTNPLYPWGRLKRRAYLALERLLLKGPDRIIFLTSRISDLYDKHFGPWMQSKKRAVITNGYDPTDFQARRLRANSKLRLTHVGNFYGSRNPILFLAHLAAYIKSGSAMLDMEIHFVGSVHGDDLAETLARLTKENDLSRYVTWRSAIPHVQAMAQIQEADVNLLITHSQGSDYAIPGKLFEYMGAQKPILALTEDPLVTDLVEQKKLGWVCRNGTDLASWFKTYLNQPALVRSHHVDPVLIEPFQLPMIHASWERFILEST